MTIQAIYRDLVRLHNVVNGAAAVAYPFDLERRHHFAARQIWWAVKTLEPLLSRDDRKELGMSTEETETPAQEPAAPALPDPRATGLEYRKTATIWAVQMEEPFTVVTLEGTLSGRAGDWLAQGPGGERWPIKAEVFAASYVPVGAAP